MKLPDKLYETLKWILVIVVPAFVAMFPKICEAWGWQLPVDAIITTITSSAAFLGIILGISTAEYNKQQAEAKANITSKANTTAKDSKTK